MSSIHSERAANERKLKQQKWQWQINNSLFSTSFSCIFELLARPTLPSITIYHCSVWKQIENNRQSVARAFADSSQFIFIIYSYLCANIFGRIAVSCLCHFLFANRYCSKSIFAKLVVKPIVVIVKQNDDMFFTLTHDLSLTQFSHYLLMRKSLRKAYRGRVRVTACIRFTDKTKSRERRDSCDFSFSGVCYWMSLFVVVNYVRLKNSAQLRLSLCLTRNSIGRFVCNI